MSVERKPLYIPPMAQEIEVGIVENCVASPAREDVNSSNIDDWYLENENWW